MTCICFFDVTSAVHCLLLFTRPGDFAKIRYCDGQYQFLAGTMALTLRQLKYFVATAELGQISQAAIQLTISQSAVTNAIKELEDSLGTRLFMRTASGMTLTNTGRRFLNQAYTILSSVDEAMRIPNLESTLTGTLTLAASYTVLGYFLPHHIQRLNTLYPRLAI